MSGATDHLVAAEQQLAEAYLCEAVTMGLILFIGLFWLSALVADYLRARRNEEQLRGEIELRRGMRAWRRGSFKDGDQ